MRKIQAVSIAVAGLFIVACADPSTSPNARSVGGASFAKGGNSGLTLHPNGFGEKSYAAWKAQEGLPDANGNANQALYFQKMTATETFSAGVAVVNGLEGQPASALTGLSWERRNDGWCGAGAPRWNVGLTDGTHNYTVFLGCSAAAHSPGSAPNWTRDSYPGPALAAQIAAQTGGASNLTITGLAIVFDEGLTLYGLPLGPGFVFLDNITVNSTVWTSPADNGGQ